MVLLFPVCLENSDLKSIFALGKEQRGVVVHALHTEDKPTSFRAGDR